MKITAKHAEFIRLVANGTSQTDAYRVTSGNKLVTSSVAKVKGSQLAKKYALQIQEARENAQKVIEQANKEKEAEIALKQILTQAEVDAKLCKIINGELIEVQQLNKQGKVFKALITPTISEQRLAIETYNKRFGSNEAIKTEIKADIQTSYTDKIVEGMTVEQLFEYRAKFLNK